jgi:hypothetical protein
MTGRKPLLLGGDVLVPDPSFKLMSKMQNHVFEIGVVLKASADKQDGFVCV